MLACDSAMGLWCKARAVDRAVWRPHRDALGFDVDELARHVDFIHEVCGILLRFSYLAWNREDTSC